MMTILNHDATAVHLLQETTAGACARRISIPALQSPHYNRNVYSAELLDHFQNPRNAGEVADPDRSARLENPVCGDILELTLKLEGKRIADIRFRAKGCVSAMACGSAITELAKGKNVDQARQVSREELVQKVGGLPEASAHASQLAMDTLAALLRDI
ncbi:MAG: iron-sulfur cluster assembly scaffold protein [Terriglobales bacterium]|jgi:nitrogen fixation protein NifU and related proteins